MSEQVTASPCLKTAKKPTPGLHLHGEKQLFSDESNLRVPTDPPAYRNALITRLAPHRQITELGKL